MVGLTVSFILLLLPMFGDAVRWETIKVKYTFVFGGLYKIPLRVKDIKSEFKYLSNHNEFPQAKIYCYPKDPRICPFYDAHDNIAGLRVAYIKKDLATKSKGVLPYSYDKPIFKQGSAYDELFYYIDVLFISPTSLKAGGPDKRDEPVGDGVYINMDGQQWTAIPRKEADIKKTKFKKQACFPGMGIHYFYDITPAMQCDDHVPPFLLYDKGELIGMGLVSFGRFKSRKRKWFENPPKSIIKKIVPDGPHCIGEWVDKYGAISFHIFFKKRTRLICVPLLNKLT